MKYPDGHGIYAIKSKVNGRRYVGQGAFRSRWPQHIALLRSGKHHNKALQADWIALGEAAFEFQVLEIVADDGRMGRLEQRYILETEDSYNADASTRIIRAGSDGRGISSLGIARGMSIGDFWVAAVMAGGTFDYQAARRYWYGSREGKSGGEPLRTLSLSALAVMSRVFEVPIATVARHLMGDAELP